MKDLIICPGGKFIVYGREKKQNILCTEDVQDTLFSLNIDIRSVFFNLLGFTMIEITPPHNYMSILM